MSSLLHLLPLNRLQESTVVPLLMQGLQSLCKERPEDPVEYLANYLLQHNPKKGQAGPAAASGTAAKPE
jgi:protein dpy-30